MNETLESVELEVKMTAFRAAFGIFSKNDRFSNEEKISAGVLKAMVEVNHIIDESQSTVSDRTGDTGSYLSIEAAPIVAQALWAWDHNASFDDLQEYSPDGDGGLIFTGFAKAMIAIHYASIMKDLIMEINQDESGFWEHGADNALKQLRATKKGRSVRTKA